MRKVGIGVLIILLMLSFAIPVDAKKYKTHKDNVRDKLSIDIKKGSVWVEFTGRDIDDRIEITENYKLFLNGDRIPLNDDQTEIVKLFYKQVQKLKKNAVAIGWEGAKIGVEGAKLGLKAIGRVIKLISPNYDTDDLEQEMERDAEAIEARAKELEKRAELVEDLLEELDDLAYEMKKEIPELQKLEWL